DASSLYLKLIKKQQADPTFHIDAQFEDSIAKTNRYLIILCIMILVDNYNCSCLTAAAIHQLYYCREAWVLCFIHHAFNADVQSTQHVESYNAKIKNCVNELSSVLELEQSVEKLLEKESCFVHLNETMSQLPCFLMSAILKFQQNEINHSIHYRCHIVNLENKLEQQ
ncbi:9746_t:CDS:2, partial [Cetraspora pellucida]